MIAIANTMAEQFADSVPCYCGPVPELLASCPLCMRAAKIFSTMNDFGHYNSGVSGSL